MNSTIAYYSESEPTISAFCWIKSTKINIPLKREKHTPKQTLNIT